MSHPWMAGLLGGSTPKTAAAVDQAKLLADKKRAAEAFEAAKAFDPVLAALFKTELEWRQQSRVDGKTIESANELRAAIVALAKQIGWEPA